MYWGPLWYFCIINTHFNKQIRVQNRQPQNERLPDRHKKTKSPFTATNSLTGTLSILDAFLSIFSNIYIYILCVCLCIHTCLWTRACMEVRRQTTCRSWLSFLPCGFWVLNSDHQTWGQVSSPAEHLSKALRCAISYRTHQNPPPRNIFIYILVSRKWKLQTAKEPIHV